MTNSKARKERKNPIRSLYYWSLEQAEKSYADWFIGAYSFLEPIIIPLPADPLLLARATAKPNLALWVSFYVTLTSLLGAFTSYFIGFYFWDSINPYFYTYIFSQETFDLVAAKINESTFLFTFIGAFSPLPFKVFAVTAGSMSLSFLPFALGTLFGRGIRYFTLGLLIYFFGESIKEFIDRKLEFLFLIGSLIVIILLALKIFFF